MKKNKERPGCIMVLCCLLLYGISERHFTYGQMGADEITTDAVPGMKPTSDPSNNSEQHHEYWTNYDKPIIDNCTASNLDLLLVADGNASRHFEEQERYLKTMLDMFDSGKADDFSRVNVSVVAACPRLKSFEVDLKVSIPFGRFSSKKDLRNAISLRDMDLRCRFAYVQDIQDAVFESVTVGSRTVLVIILTHTNEVRAKRNNKAEKIWAQSDRVKMLTIFAFHEEYFNPPHIDKSFFTEFLIGRIIFSSLDFLSEDQSIPLTVCAKCDPEWIFYSPPTGNASLSVASCYKIFELEAVDNWMSASSKCVRTYRSGLVSIENERESEFLEMAIRKHVLLKNKPKSFFIGLKRNAKSMQREFTWINKNPLVYSRWQTGQPFGRKTKECALWEVSKNVTPGISGGHADGWVGVGCGDRRSSWAICETQAVILSADLSIARTFVNVTKIDQALRRGDFAFNVTNGDALVDGAFYSTSALLSDSKFQSKHVQFSIYHISGNMITLSGDDVKLFSCNRGVNIPYSYVSDNYIDCSWSGADENEGRALDVYSPDKFFQCNSGHKVSLDFKCDLFPDCPDASDEKGMCIRCEHVMCESGECLPKHWFHDGQPDCAECQYDTDLDHGTGAKDCVFTCNKTECVKMAMLGDGVIQCTGPEGPLDETVGALDYTTCESNSDRLDVTPWGPKCVLEEDVYGGILGCRYFTHLQGCEDFVCEEGYIKCPYSYCIPVHYVSDNTRHCPMGEDETSMKVDCTGLFRCEKKPNCLHPDRVCDGKQDCYHGDDELNCHFSCRQGFVCVAGTVVRTDYDTIVPLTSLDFVDERARYVDVSGVDISATLSSIVCQNWKKLIHLNVSGCNISSVDVTECMRSETLYVKVFDLSHNFLLEEFVSALLYGVPYVEYLNLSHNPNLRSLHVPYLKWLLEIDLSYTEISTLTFDSSYDKLARVNLRSSKLSDLRPGIFPKHVSILDLRDIQLPHIYPNSFKSVEIASLYTSSYKLCCPQLHGREETLEECHAPDDPFSSCSDLMGGLTMRTVLWVNGCVALCGNLIVAINRLVCDRSALKMAYGHFVVHLSIADFFMGVYLVTIASADMYFRHSYYVNERLWRQSVACKFAGFLSTLSSETSMLFILFITLDRFLVIKFPFGQYRISGRYIHVLCVTAWILGFCLAILPFLPPFQHWQTYSFNGVCLGLPLGDRSQLGFEFALSVFVFLNLGLFMLIAIGQLVIYRAVSEIRRSTASRTSNPTARRAEDIEVAKRLFLVAATDFMCWFPIGVMGLVSLTGFQLGYRAYAWSAILIVPINSAINPILYNASNIMNGCRAAYGKVMSLHIFSDTRTDGDGN